VIGIYLVDVIEVDAVKWMVANGGAIAKDHSFAFGTSECYVHAACIGTKAYFTFIVGAYQTDVNHITFLPLKRIGGFDLYD